MVAAAGHTAGLTLIDRCVALIAGIRNGQLIPRASFFQLHNIRLAHQNGDPQWLLQHELVHIFRVTSRLGHASEEITNAYYIAKPALAPDVSDILEQLRAGTP
jgi:hypothetical protein